MWLWQLCWFTLTLIISTSVLISIGAFVFILVRKLSKKFLNQPHHHVDILFAGTVMLALSQLFGPLFAASYPLVLGPDASDYSLSFQSMYLNLSYNSASGNYTIMSTADNFGKNYNYINETSIRVGDRVYINDAIIANNLNPFMSYDAQIFLNITTPDSITAILSKPVINVGQRSDLIIEFEKIIPDPGPYLIKVQGIGGDGKTRDSTMVLAVTVPSSILLNHYYTTSITGGYSGSTTCSVCNEGTTYMPNRPFNTTGKIPN